MHYRQLRSLDPIQLGTLYIDPGFDYSRKHHDKRLKMRVKGYVLHEVADWHCPFTHCAIFYWQAKSYWKFRWYFPAGMPRGEMIQQAEAVLDLLKLAGENLHEVG